MTQIDTTTFTVSDPRQYDGDPFDVAARACAQAEHIARVLAQCTDTAAIMARNSEFERSFQLGEDPDPLAWDESPAGKKFVAVHQAAERLESELAALGRAAGYNPKKPPKA